MHNTGPPTIPTKNPGSSYTTTSLVPPPPFGALFPGPLRGGASSPVEKWLPASLPKPRYLRGVHRELRGTPPPERCQVVLALLGKLILHLVLEGSTSSSMGTGSLLPMIGVECTWPWLPCRSLPSLPCWPPSAPLPPRGGEAIEKKPPSRMITDGGSRRRVSDWIFLCQF